MEIESRIYEQSFSFQLTRSAGPDYHLIKTAVKFMQPDNRLNLILVRCNRLDGVVLSQICKRWKHKDGVGGKTCRIPLWLLRLFSIQIKRHRTALLLFNI